MGSSSDVVGVSAENVFLRRQQRGPEEDVAIEDISLGVGVLTWSPGVLGITGEAGEAGIGVSS